MPFACKICKNTGNNRVHEMREMMFGTREKFDYLECGACGTIQIIEVPDLRRHYPPNYFSLEKDSEIEFVKKFKRRLAARFAGDYFVKKRGFIGKYLVEKKPWLSTEFPPSLRDFPLGIDFDSRILDFGCGRGRLLQVLYHFGFRNLTGADAFIDSDIFYPNGIKIYNPTRTKFEPFFDLIMLHHVFEHLPDPRQSLRDIASLLGKDKYCLVRMPVVNFAWEKYGANWVQLDPPRHVFIYTEESFRALAEEAGFTIAKVVYDSTAFQFWGSEQFLRDIPLEDERSFRDDFSKGIFTREQIEAWEKQAEELNARGKGDQACFYLRFNS